MKDTLLHVVTATLQSPADAQHALRHLRRLRPQGHEPNRVLLLFADLSAADSAHLPEDAAMIRALQSGVMAMNARVSGAFLLLVRRRMWNDAARQYLGCEQPLSCRTVIAQLLAAGRTDASFDAATFTPGSLMGRFDAVLFSGDDLLCTPDTPARLRASLPPCGILAAPVQSPYRFPETVFARLIRSSGFSLSPIAAARETALLQKGLCPADRPTMYTADALRDSLKHPCSAAPMAKDCLFVRLFPPSLRTLFSACRVRCLHRADLQAVLPLIQLLLLFCAAASGLSPLAALALVPEIWTLVHPRQLPGALLRTALLPLTALVSLDALLCHLFARSPLIRLRLPDALISYKSGLLLGGVLLSLAVFSAQALVPLLPIALSWLGMPLLLPALDTPTIARIPLRSEQRAQLRALAKAAYPRAAQTPHAHPAFMLLTACAGCMLGLLEPDEAARQVQTLLAQDTDDDAPVQQAAMLACAQFLRERMTDCDAALRPLPAGIERHVLDRCDLSALFAGVSSQQALSALFLPLGPARAMAQHPDTLPLTHPHTFLARRLRVPDASPVSSDPVACFLGLAAGALDHPFYALLTRSPVAAPYAAAETHG